MPDIRVLARYAIFAAFALTGTAPAAANPGSTDVVVTSSSHGRGTCRGCFVSPFTR